MTHIIDVQYAIDESGLPDKSLLAHWANTALQHIDGCVELTIRIVDVVEGAQLNEKWSEKTGPTNVLSFPAELNHEIQPKLLGDIVICAPIIAKEAEQQGKTVNNHWAHMVIHGALHLLGYDHINRKDAKAMESLEIEVLNKLEIENPYH